ncbi:MAG TPA: MFS transporter, partial [Steroidobacteraceae bacterium]|nr:MFS transporter [Steroidobacteraceae bacterium]
SLGLVIAAGSASGAHWRHAYLLHGAIFAALAAAALLLPRSAAAGPRRAPLALLAGRAGLPPLRLALAVGLLILLGLGVSVVFPSWLSRHQGASVGNASRILAAANLVMIVGGTLSGLLLARGVRPATLFTALAVCGCIAGIGIFMPQPGLAAIVAALVGWSLCTGAAMAVLAARLPHVAAPEHRAAVAGLLSQSGALLTFVTPSVWLFAAGTGRWSAPASIVVVGWFAAALLLPARGQAPAAAAR